MTRPLPSRGPTTRARDGALGLACLILALVALTAFVGLAATPVEAAPPYTTNTTGTTQNGILEALTDIQNNTANPPAPVGGATASNQTTANGKLDTIITNTGTRGQAAGSGSIPVVLSSDPDIRPASGTITATDSATASTAGQDSVSNISGTPTANSFQTWAINGQSAVRVAISGTWTGTLQFEGSADGGFVYVPIPLRVVGSVYTRSSVTGNGTFFGDVSGLTHFRVRETAAHTGTATIKPTFSAAGGPVNLLNPVRVADNSSGASLTVKPASTPAATTDPAVVVDQRPTELHVGEVGGNATTITAAQTVTASSAYASGNAVGGLITVSNVARVSAGSGLIQSVIIDTKSAQTTSTDLVLFNANPSGSTCTDKTAFSVAAADFDKIIGVAHVTDWTSLGTPSVGQAQNLAMPFALASGATVYACLVTRGTPTFAATTDVSVTLRVLRN
jgi:hypothetical protein